VYSYSWGLVVVGLGDGVCGGMHLWSGGRVTKSPDWGKEEKQKPGKGERKKEKARK